MPDCVAFRAWPGRCTLSFAVAISFVAACSPVAKDDKARPPAASAAHGVSTPHAEPDATLHLAIAQSPASLNPLLATTIYDQQVASLVYDQLLVPDAHNHLEPDLATVVPTPANGGISRDGKTVTFHLRRGVKWQDGAPFTSADVAFTFAKILDRNVDVAQRTGYDRIAHVATPDPYTIVLTLASADASFVTIVSTQYQIVPKHLLEHSADINRDPIGSHPVGTGPYRFVSWQRGNRIEFAANRDYFAGPPLIGKLRVSEIPDSNTEALELKAHHLDEAAVESSAWGDLRNDSNLAHTIEPFNAFVAYALNIESPLMHDVRVRRAISMAIDRVGITHKVTYDSNSPAYADLAPSLWTVSVPPNPYSYNPNAANVLLDLAGWKRGSDGMRSKNGVALRLRVADFSGSTTSAIIDTQVDQMLESIGIASSVKYTSPSIYFESLARGGTLAKGDFDMAFFTFSANADVANDELYTCAAREPHGFNVPRYCSPQMEALQRESLTTFDLTRRLAVVARIERLAVTDVPYVFLYNSNWRLIFNPKLHRMHSNVNTDWYDVRDWYFDPS